MLRFNSPKLHIVVELAPHEPNDMSDVRDCGCYHRRLLRDRHTDERKGEFQGCGGSQSVERSTVDGLWAG